MKKGLYIVGLIAFLAVFAACEKCDKPVMMEDPFDNSTTRGGLSDFDEIESDLVDPNQRGGEDITDPDEDSDFDGIVDPDEDEDFDGIVDPDEDEDFDEDISGK